MSTEEDKINIDISQLKELLVPNKNEKKIQDQYGSVTISYTPHTCTQNIKNYNQQYRRK